MSEEKNMQDGLTNGRTILIPIEEEVKASYLNYAMSVIVSRALPDVRDGMKPVHRRILYAMSDMALWSNTPFKKCGRIVGDVLGKYHPHGDQSIYDALARMGQEFSLRYPLVDGQGNFGSVDGDPPAAMRYTEARLSRLAEMMLRDIKRETVDFGPNYDDAMIEPLVLPAAFPALLANGATGIAVGMATTIPPHNMGELANAIAAIIDNPDTTEEELMQLVRGPDFPTGGVIHGSRGIRDAYTTGRGQIVVRSQVSIESKRDGKDMLVITEIPYLVNKATLITRIAELVRNRKLDGIDDLRDESDRDGLRIVIELKRGIRAHIILNQLFQQTQLQSNFNVNMLALVGGRPRLLTLIGAIRCFIEHRREVVTRRARYDLRKAEERAHILEGLQIAIDNITEVIRLIRQSKTVNSARASLRRSFALSETQAQAILDMRLQKLTSLETRKIAEELAELRKQIAALKELLASEAAILNVVKRETLEISQQFDDGRRTAILPDETEAIEIEDLIQRESMVVLISNEGYIKRTSISAYRVQRRGGKGMQSSNLRVNDFVRNIFTGTTHDYILFVSSAGKAYWLKVHEIPEASRTARGQHVRRLLAVETDETISEVISLQEFSASSYLFMATARGIVKKVCTTEFANARARGIRAIRLDKGDRLISATLTNDKLGFMMITRNGFGLRFSEHEVRATGRSARGVIGIRLQDDDEIAGVVTVDAGRQVLLISEAGMGKQLRFSDFQPHGRGTRGQRAYTRKPETGPLVGVLSVHADDHIITTTSQGNTVKLQAQQIPTQGRAARGVRILAVAEPNRVVAVKLANSVDIQPEIK